MQDKEIKTMWRLPDGRIINRPERVVIDGETYSTSVFRNWSKAKLIAVGIHPFREIKYDQENYISTGFSDDTVDGVVTRTHTTIPKYNINNLKEMRIEVLHLQAKSHLERTDWYVVRKSELDTAIPAEVVTARAFIREHCNTVEAEINALETYDEVVDYTWNWEAKDDPETVTNEKDNVFKWRIKK